MEYKVRITEVFLIGGQIRIDGTLFEDDVDRGPMPTVTVDAATATIAQAVELIKTELQKFKDSRALDALLQNYIGREITL